MELKNLKALVGSMGVLSVASSTALGWGTACSDSCSGECSEGCTSSCQDGCMSDCSNTCTGSFPGDPS